MAFRTAASSVGREYWRVRSSPGSGGEVELGGWIDTRKREEGRRRRRRRIGMRMMGRQ